MNNTLAVANALEDCFNEIYHTRMSDVPICNHRLSVKAIGFRQWHQFYIGVLVTPWFISLVMLPNTSVSNEAESLKQNNVGKSFDLALPSGNYRFLINYETSLGNFFSCSLLSPVNEIGSQKLAQDTANAALELIMGESNSSSKIASQNNGVQQPEKRALFERLFLNRKDSEKTYMSSEK